MQPTYLLSHATSEPPATGFPSEEESFLQQTPPALQGFSGLSLFSPGRAAWLHAPVLCHMPTSAFNPYGKPHPQGYTTGDCAGFLPQHLSLRPFWQLAPKIWDNQSQEQELGCWGPSVDVARSSTAPGSAQLSQRKREENQLLPFKSGQNRFLIKAALNH